MDNEKIQEHLVSLAGWKHQDKTIVKEFNFNNFMESMAFVNKIVPLAEELGHHPDLNIQYSKVRITLATHDAGGVTPKDFEMALKIDNL